MKTLRLFLGTIFVAAICVAPVFAQDVDEKAVAVGGTAVLDNTIGNALDDENQEMLDDEGYGIDDSEYYGAEDENGMIPEENMEEDYLAEENAGDEEYLSDEINNAVVE